MGVLGLWAGVGCREGAFCARQEPWRVLSKRDLVSLKFSGRAWTVEGRGGRQGSPGGGTGWGWTRTLEVGRRHRILGLFPSSNLPQVDFYPCVAAEGTEPHGGLVGPPKRP